DRGGPGGNSFTLTVPPTTYTGTGLHIRKSLSGTNLEVLNNNVLIDSRPLAAVTSVTLNGVGDATDTATIDYAFGGAFTIPGGITFNGGSGTLSSNTLQILIGTDNAQPNAITDVGATGAFSSNTLQIQGGTFDTDTYTYTTATGTGNNGTIQLGTGAPLITYTNLTPLSNTGTAANIIFNLPGGTVGATLQDDPGGAGNNLSEL